MSWQEELNAKRLKTKGWYGCIAPDGWQKIVEETDAMLAYLDPDYEIFQVKEKYGTLRYYFGSSKDGIVADIMRAIENNAETRSAGICQVCGKWGETRWDRSWVQTLCEEHNEL